MKDFIRSLGTFLLDTIEIITTAFAIFVVLFLFVVQIHEVNGDSMLPNFHDKEYVLTDKITYKFREPQRGEVVIFKAPPKPRDEYIKRLIALPGEKIKIQNNEVIIYNEEHPEGFVLNEYYLGEGTLTKGKSAIPPNTVFTVPEGEYLVFGDNRENSSDSRQWGPVKKDYLVGRAVIRIWPPTALGVVRHAEYEE
jgi:signal peptidase I